MNSKGKASWVELFENAFFKFVVSPPNTSENSEEYHGLGLDKQKLTEENIREITKNAAKKYVDKLLELGDSESNIHNADEKVLDREMRKAFRDANEEFKNAHAEN